MTQFFCRLGRLGFPRVSAFDIGSRCQRPRSPQSLEVGVNGSNSPDESAVTERPWGNVSPEPQHCGLASVRFYSPNTENQQ